MTGQEGYDTQSSKDKADISTESCTVQGESNVSNCSDSRNNLNDCVSQDHHSPSPNDGCGNNLSDMHTSETPDAHHHSKGENEDCASEHKAHSHLSNEVNHHHDHGHEQPNRQLKSLVMVLSLTIVVLLAELVGSYLSASLALLADAGHMAVDSIGLIIATFTVIMSRRPRSDKYTWGWARIEAISAAFQAGMLLVVALLVASKAVGRFSSPVEVLPTEMAIFGTVGLVANLIGLLLLHRSQHDSLNMRAAFLEVLNDTLGSVMVLVASWLYATFAFAWADSVASLLVAILMGPRAIGLLKQSLAVLMESTPPGVDLQEIRDLVLSVDHVVDIHDLHVSTISTGLFSLTAHIAISDSCFNSGHSLNILHNVQFALQNSLPISLTHCTLQLESEVHRKHELLDHAGTVVAHNH